MYSSSSLSLSLSPFFLLFSSFPLSFLPVDHADANGVGRREVAQGGRKRRGHQLGRGGDEAQGGDGDIGLGGSSGWGWRRRLERGFAPRRPPLLSLAAMPSIPRRRALPPLPSMAPGGEAAAGKGEAAGGELAARSRAAGEVTRHR
uniref:Uncharacterized protein n=1 Tax=Oryza glumipatula TaxID=40148 RepID=A0A0D9YTH7_9ORYZ